MSVSVGDGKYSEWADRAVGRVGSVNGMGDIAGEAPRESLNAAEVGDAPGVLRRT